MLRSMIKNTRCYSSIPNSKPLLMDILPSKKIISRLLFDYDAKFNINKYLPVIESIYDIPSGGKPEIPEKFKGNDLLIFQRVLAQIRKQTHTINPLLLSLENSLIEYAAERGSRDALCTLSFMALDESGDGWTDDDKITAKKYIKELMELEHPLAFKLAADRELKNFTSLTEGEGKKEEKEIKSEIIETPTSDLNFSNLTSSPKQLSRAISLYNHFLKLDSNSTVASAAHRSLGMIYFRTQDLIKSEEHFEHAVHLAPVSDNAQSHFFLGLLNEFEPTKARHHFQLAASEGYRESFENLGYLELNVFHDVDKAREWFLLGAELGVSICIVGLFDIAYRKNDWNTARSIIKKAEKQGISDILRQARKDNVEKVESEVLDIENFVNKETEASDVEQKRKSRWDL